MLVAWGSVLEECRGKVLWVMLFLLSESPSLSFFLSFLNRFKRLLLLLSFDRVVPLVAGLVSFFLFLFAASFWHTS